MKRLFFLGFLPLLFSCSEEKKVPFFKKSEKYEPLIFNLQHYFSQDEFNVSFPIWFNDSLIKLHKIEKITRSVFISEKESDSDIENETNTPKEVKTYHFNEDGALLSVQIQQFYENVEVGNVWFDYLSPKDENGYAEVERRQIKNQTLDEEHDHYSIYEKEEYNTNFLAYINQQSGNYLFYLLKSKNWGVVSVKSILQPTPEDIITFGTPLSPTKRYQVENTVNEFNVIEYTYDKSNQFITEIAYNDYPFKKKRSILYGTSGVCTGFIDSTFTDDIFLKRADSKFEFKHKLPIVLKHENHSTDSTSRFFQLERFEYSFFKKK